MVKNLVITAMLTFIMLLPSVSHGSAFSFQTGSTSIGTGGPNSMGIPPRSTDLGVTYMTKSLYEFNLNLMGLSVGRREYTSWGGIVGLGAGIILDANGLGIGPTSLFGYELFRTKGGYGLSIEYAQSLGLSFSGRLISPYIVRIGWSKWF